jgi:hypothetical protein
VLKLGHLENTSEIPGSFEMWCWRRMDKISWTDHVRNKSVTKTKGGEEYPANNKNTEA